MKVRSVGSAIGVITALVVTIGLHAGPRDASKASCSVRLFLPADKIDLGRDNGVVVEITNEGEGPINLPLPVRAELRDLEKWRGPEGARVDDQSYSLILVVSLDPANKADFLPPSSSIDPISSVTIARGSTQLLKIPLCPLVPGKARVCAVLSRGRVVVADDAGSIQVMSGSE